VNAKRTRTAFHGPVPIGPILRLKHRIVMAPMTTSADRSSPAMCQGDLQLEYYTQRASDGGLIIAEGTAVLPAWARRIRFPPVCGPDGQVSGWAPHHREPCMPKGAFMFAQLWQRRPPGPTYRRPAKDPVAPSVDPDFWNNPPGQASMVSTWRTVCSRPLRRIERCRPPRIDGIIGQFVTAAENAKTAGFDGIELHGRPTAYLLDEFPPGRHEQTDRRLRAARWRTDSGCSPRCLPRTISVWGAKIEFGVRPSQPGGTFTASATADADTTFGYCRRQTQRVRAGLSSPHRNRGSMGSRSSRRTRGAVTTRRLRARRYHGPASWPLAVSNLTNRRSRLSLTARPDMIGLRASLQSPIPNLPRPHSTQLPAERLPTATHLLQTPGAKGVTSTTQPYDGAPGTDTSPAPLPRAG